MTLIGFNREYTNIIILYLLKNVACFIGFRTEKGIYVHVCIHVVQGRSQRYFLDEAEIGKGNFARCVAPRG